MLKIKMLENGCCPHVEGYLPSEIKNPKNDEGQWDYFSEAFLEPIFREIPGQHATTGLGQAIFELASQNDGPTKWLEVGTWNGNGTTLCVLTGLMKREKKEDLSFFSYECDPFMFKIATENLKYHPMFENCFFIVNGRLPGAFEFPSETDIHEADKYPTSHFHLAFEREKALFQTAKEVAPSFLPEAVVLDGGLYTGIFDWKSVDKTSLRYVFLDDVNIIKHKRVYDELSSNPEWILAIENKTELNGWAFFKRI